MICYPISNYAVKSKKLVFPLFSALLLLTSLLPAITSAGVFMGQNIHDSLTFRNIERKVLNFHITRIVL